MVATVGLYFSFNQSRQNIVSRRLLFLVNQLARELYGFWQIAEQTPKVC